MIEFYGVQDVYSESGVDLTQLRRNLQLSVDARMKGNAGMLPFLMDTQKYVPAGMPDAGRELPMLQVEPLLRLLADHQVDYVLIGGLAMTVHGSAYVTKDLDVCYLRTPRNIAALAQALTSIHAYLRGVPPGLPFRFDVPTIQAGSNFTLTTDLGDVDVLGQITGIGDYSQALAQSVEKSVFNLTIRVLSLDGLIAAKKASARTKDKLHLLELEELKKLRDETNKE